MSELARRIAITIGALLIFRLGSYIPLPGIRRAGRPAVARIRRPHLHSLALPHVPI